MRNYDKKILFRWPTSKGYNEIYLLTKKSWFRRNWWWIWGVGMVLLIVYKIKIGDFQG